MPITSLNRLKLSGVLYSDDDAIFDRVIELDVSTLEPQVTWGTENLKWSVNFSEPFTGNQVISMINVRMIIWGYRTRTKAEDIDLGYVFSVHVQILDYQI